MSLLGRLASARLATSPEVAPFRLPSWVPTDARRGVPVVTALLTIALLGFVARYGRNLPVQDEWFVVPD